MLNNDVDLDNQLERVQDDLAINESESDENLQGTQRLTIHRCSCRSARLYMSSKNQHLHVIACV